MTADTFARLAPLPSDAEALIARDRWGRPLIFMLDADGNPTDKTEAYTRASTAGKALEDTYHLGLWQQRQVLVGAQVDPSLLLEVEALGPQPSKNDEAAYKAWKNAMDALVKRSHDAAGSQSRAGLGTFMHTVFQALDQGEPAPEIPEGFRDSLTPAMVARDAAARAAVTQGWIWLGRELFVVNDEWKIAGTVDGIVLRPHPSKPSHWLITVVDDKTGSSVEFSVLGFAVQVAAYVLSRLYDPRTGVRTPYTALIPPHIDPATVEIDLDTAFIIHTAVGEGRCDLQQAPLQKAAAALAMAADVRATRTASTKWLKLVERKEMPPLADEDLPTPKSAPKVKAPRSAGKSLAIANVTDPVDRIADEIAAATSVEALLAIRDRALTVQTSNSGNTWQAWTPAHEELAAARAAQLTTTPSGAPVAVAAVEPQVDPVMARIWSATSLDDLTEVWNDVMAGGAWTTEHDTAAQAKAAQLRSSAA